MFCGFSPPSGCSAVFDNILNLLSIRSMSVCACFSLDIDRQKPVIYTQGASSARDALLKPIHVLILAEDAL